MMLFKNPKRYPMRKQLVRSKNSWPNMLLLPYKLFILFNNYIENKKLKSIENNLLKTIEVLYQEKGLNVAETYLLEVSNKTHASAVANAYTTLARLSGKINPLEELRLAHQAVNFDPKPFRKKWLAFRMFNCGEISKSYLLLSSLPISNLSKTSEQNKALHVSGCYRLLHNSVKIPARLTQPILSYKSNNPVVLYVAASSQPHNVTGYTIRTHNILKALQNFEFKVTCITRPGYPDDREDILGDQINRFVNIDGVYYKSIIGPHRFKIPYDEYINIAADLIFEEAQILNASIIHAASNYENALPALIAARRLGIPFIYEVRGLWEYTTASKYLAIAWEETESFKLTKQLETITVSEADHVFTLNQALADELRNRGVTSNNISVIPNTVNINSFTPRPKDTNLAVKLNIPNDAFVIGYLGSLINYEGIDDLIIALKQILPLVPNAYALIVGNGLSLSYLIDLSKKLGIEKHVVFVDKVMPEHVCNYFSLMNTVVLPRKPYKVCELVTPIKPFEVMAMRIPLIVSDVAPLKEIIKDNINGLIFSAGNTNQLAEKLLMLATNVSLRTQIAEEAYRSILQHPTWDQIAEEIIKVYSSLVKTKHVQ